VDAVLDYIKEHYRENLTNLMLAKKFSYHPNYISRLVKDHTGMTLHRYLLDYRIKKALLFLKSGEYNVSDAASAVGFSDIKHFSKCFRRHMGCPPSTFLPVANDKT
jgi:two-component system response regulator YesN